MFGFCHLFYFNLITVPVASISYFTKIKTLKMTINTCLFLFQGSVQSFQTPSMTVSQKIMKTEQVVHICSISKIKKIKFIIN